MGLKNIINIVFYSFIDEYNEKKTQACIFYDDDSVKNVTLNEGIEITYEFARSLGINDKERLYEILNKKYVHVVSGDTFEKNFQKYKSATDEEKEIASKSKANNLIQRLGLNYKKEDNKSNKDIDHVKKSEAKDSVSSEIPIADELADTDTERPKKYQDNFINFPPQKKYSLPKKEGIFKKLKKKTRRFFKSMKVKVAAIGTAISLALGGCAFSTANHLSKSGQMNDSNIEYDVENVNLDSANTQRNNDMYNNYSFEELQAVNYVIAQQNAMKNIKDSFDITNVNFANNILEEDKNVKFGLKWEEMIALQQAYNDYSSDEIKAIFNGEKINAIDMSNSYKSATLLLMGAHVVESRENPVNMEKLINSTEGKYFYNKYHEMFLGIKEAQGQDQIDKLNTWNQSLLQDFPITDEVREVGIAHSENRNVEAYKLAITPMVAAVEIMYQNLAIDHTLSDKTIAYFNDMGLCNIAEDAFEKVERITEDATENNAEPLYVQYKEAITNKLIMNGNYPTTDEIRDISKLEAFKKAVNSNNNIAFSYDDNFAGYSSYGSSSTSTSTDTSTETTTEKTKNRDYAVDKTSEKEVKDAENKADKKIDKENEKAKKEAEKEAEEKRKEMQNKEDQKKEDLENKVAEDNKDLQDKIDSANDKINDNNADQNPTNDELVNEKDFGDHNVDFDNSHSDNNGNLDDSVKDITTDDSGYDPNEELPDPNQTGKEFDAKGISNEEIADMIISNLESQAYEDYEESYQYVK